MRRRILLAIVGASTVAVLLFGIPLGLAVQRNYQDEEIVRLEREAAEATLAVSPASLTSRDPIELPHSTHRHEFALYDTHSKRIAGVGPETADAAVRRALRGSVTETRTGSHYVVVVPITSNEVVVAAVRAATPSSAVTSRTRTAWLVMTMIGVGALGVSAGIGVYLSRRLTRPVDALAHSAVRLGAGDFSARSPRSGVPELDEVADALDATADRLGNALARERAFSADASHQLRTPLTALRVQLESGALHASPDTSPMLHAALSEVDRLDHTIDDLLALARDEHGPRSVLDLPRVLDSVENAWRGPLATVGRPLAVRAEANLPPVLASEAAIHQVLDVLAANAVAHGSGEVTITARRAPGGMAIEVADEGPGLTGDPEQAFVRRSTNGEGHGIGLALARSLTEAEGGRLVIEHARPNPIFAVILTTTSE